MLTSAGLSNDNNATFFMGYECFLFSHTRKDVVQSTAGTRFQLHADPIQYMVILANSAVSVSAPDVQQLRCNNNSATLVFDGKHNHLGLARQMETLVYPLEGNCFAHPSPMAAWLTRLLADGTLTPKLPCF